MTRIYSVTLGGDDVAGYFVFLDNMGRSIWGKILARAKRKVAEACN